MLNNIVNFVLRIAGGSKWLATMLVSCFPLIELKGAIPVGVKLGLPLWQAGLLGFVGSTFVAIPLLLLLKPIFNLLKKIPFLNRIENIFKEKANKVSEKSFGKKNYNTLMFWAVLIFVSIPIPLTGVYTGCAVAVFVGLKFWPALLAVIIGNFIAGVVIVLLCLIVGIAAVDYILYGLLAIVCLIVVYYIVKTLKSRPA